MSAEDHAKFTKIHADKELLDPKEYVLPDLSSLYLLNQHPIRSIVDTSCIV
jgi:hypothetical protein